MATLTLQAILDQTAGKTADDVAGIVKAAATADGVDPADITGVMDDALEKFASLNEQEKLVGDDLAAFEALGEVIKATRAVQTEIAEADAAAKAARDELAATVLGTDQAEEEAAGDEQETAETEPAEQADASEAAPEPVTAAAKPLPRINLASIKGKAPEPAPTKPDTGLTITAAAGVRGVENGASLDMDGLVAAVQARIQGMPFGTTSGAVVKDGVAQIKVAYPTELVASGQGDDTRVVDHAGDQTRLDGGLVASGGWCAPSETLYELGDNLADANAGLVDVPDIQVKRGGIKFTRGASYAEVWAGNAGKLYTEADGIANTTKVLYRPGCPTFEEVRADAIYSGIIVGFLQNDAYPETTRDAVSNVTAVHAHRVNAETLKRMDAASTAVDLTTLGPSATGSILNGIGLTLMDTKYRLRASESLVLDVVLPIWSKEIVRADYSLREGIPYEAVTDQQISSWIAQRGGRVQWDYDWQDAYTTTPAAGFGGATAITAYPTEVNALVYPSGTFVRGRGDVVNLDMVYDSTMTQANDYLQMFMEEKLLVAKRAHSSAKVKLALGVNGATGAARVLDGNGKIAPTAP